MFWKSRYLWSYSKIEGDFLGKICTFEWALDYLPLFILIFDQNYSSNQRKLHYFNPLHANPKKRSNTLKQFVGNFTTNCLSVFGHFAGLAPKDFKFNLGLFWLFMWQILKPLAAELGQLCDSPLLVPTS